MLAAPLAAALPADPADLTVSEAIALLRQHRVIHRDLKPATSSSPKKGTVKLLDFGIAKLVRVDADQKTALATRTGMRLMTPNTPARNRSARKKSLRSAIYIPSA